MTNPAGTASARVGFGAMDLSEPPRDEVAATSVLLRASELGVAIVDTADRYGRGHNEELIGRVLGPAARVPLGTKIGFVGSPTDHRPVDNRPATLRRALEASLRRLGRDDLDVVSLHRVDPAVPFEDSIGALLEFREAGLVRRIGVSEVGPRTLRRLLEVGSIDVLQIEYSLLSRTPGDELVALTAAAGIELQASSPMGVGLLARDPSHLLDERAHHRRLRVSPRTDGEHRHHNHEKLAQLDRLGAESGRSRVELCLGWLCAQGDHVVPLPGTRRTDHLEANVEAAAHPLPADVLARLDEDFPPGAFHGPRKPPAALQLSLP